MTDPDPDEVATNVITLTANPDLLWRLEVDGRPFEMRPGAITPAQASALRQHSRGAWRVPTLMDAVNEGGIGPEELVGLVFLAERQGAKVLTYEAVGELIAGAAEVRIDFNATPEVDDPQP